MTALDTQFQTQLASWLRSPKAESPLLLHGTSALNWEAILNYAAEAAACVRAAETPCGTCSACRQAKARQHPNVLWVAPEEASIKIKDINQIREELTRTTFSGRRLIIIPQANRLLLEAANSLLKELEEPTTSNRFLLTTSYLKRVLPTIVSRCQLLRLTGPVITPAAPDPAIWEKLDAPSTKDSLTEEELAAISDYLLELGQKGQTTPAVYRTMLRLRDYYKIRAHRGNDKLAAQILLASLSQVRHTRN